MQTISCDICGKPVLSDEIYVDHWENTICLNCHNDRIWRKGFWDGLVFGTVIAIIMGTITVLAWRIF